MANEITSDKYGHSISYDIGPDCGLIAGMHLTGGRPVVHEGVKFVRFETKYKGQTIQVKYEARPELAALVVEYDNIQAQLKIERETKWAADKAIKDAADQPLLDAMQAHAAELKAQIPTGHIQVTVKQTGDTDGDPILEYTADGVKLNWRDVNNIGTASAIRPGALGAFASEHVCSIGKDRLAEIREMQAAKAATAQAAKEVRQVELKTTIIPDEALSAYNHYHGDANKAWENEDETSWALIQKWTPYIETQHGIDIEKIKRTAAETNRETSFGINEG